MPNLVKPDRLCRARQLRKDMTGTEKKVWQQLRAHRSGAHFRRQVPLGPFIADFVCRSAWLVVEIDGDQHGRPMHAEADRKRDAFLASHGYRTLRFSNWQVMNEFESVMLTIEAALHGDLDACAYACLPASLDAAGTDASLSRNGGEMERGPTPGLTSAGATPSQPSPVPGEGSRAHPGTASGGGTGGFR